MRIVVVWFIAFVLLFAVTIGWYISIPVVLGVSRGLGATTSSNPQVANIATAIEYVSYAWGPILDIFILLWAVISSQQRDVESEMYS